MTGNTTAPAHAPTDTAPAAIPELHEAPLRPSAQGYRRPVRLLLWGAGPAHLRFLKSLQKAPIAHAEITLLSPHAQVFSPRMLAGFMANEYTISQVRDDRILLRELVSWVKI